MTYSTLRYENDAGIAVCTFARPAVRNALNAEMAAELHLVLARAQGEQARALIFSGAGDRVFMSGADIAELRERRAVDAYRMINSGLFAAIEALPVPTLAAVRGVALGGGMELAMACDLRVCGRSSRFGQPEVSLGIVPGAGALYRLPRLVGEGYARELVFSGRLIDADEALRIGLVNRVVDDAEVLHTAQAIARDIAAQSAHAVRLAKLTFVAQARAATDPGVFIDAAAQAILFEDPDKQERMTAFFNRRREDKK